MSINTHALTPRQLNMQQLDHAAQKVIDEKAKRPPGSTTDASSGQAAPNIDSPERRSACEGDNKELERISNDILAANQGFFSKINTLSDKLNRYFKQNDINNENIASIVKEVETKKQLTSRQLEVLNTAQYEIVCTRNTTDEGIETLLNEISKTSDTLVEYRNFVKKLSNEIID